MFNRIFKYNRISSILFLLSFSATFIIMYYGLNLNRQYTQVGTARLEAVYEYGCMISGSITGNIAHAYDIKDVSLQGGIVILRCEGPMGEGVINTDEIDILWMQNEEVSESVEYEKYYLDGSNIPAPKCIIGDAWKDETYISDGLRYINVFQIECCVIGEYATNTFENYDKRCLVFKDSLSQEELDKLIIDSNNIRIIYKSNIIDETELIREWTKTFLQEENYREEPLDIDVWGPINGYHFALFASLYRKVYIGMMILCFINCAFLACFWGKIHIYEYMLKRTLGYGKLKLLIDIISQFALFELISLIAVLGITFIYEMIRGGLTVWYNNICLGYIQIVLIIVLFGVLLSIFPMWIVMRQKPADVLKCAE